MQKTLTDYIITAIDKDVYIKEDIYKLLCKYDYTELFSANPQILLILKILFSDNNYVIISDNNIKFRNPIPDDIIKYFKYELYTLDGYILYNHNNYKFVYDDNIKVLYIKEMFAITVYKVNNTTSYFEFIKSFVDNSYIENIHSKYKQIYSMKL